ncbi:MAG: tRNA 2-thiouridine(34) synthase MnmA [Ilumatobacter coccineus]|uniref:tRNA-specific 2-thiouridylase MnmA n=1 Tax=Ilumatobacter coccineus TaxID=467094 RepID=A0A2G6KEM4_9ACTN|nr:MAG: tRNA 2-thiouridine(34) synthase MnmA [Ilumatobacter coccineus]
MSRIMLAMSGGVDSSVAGALLLEAGHEVVGVTMKLWGGSADSGCCSLADVTDARRVADQLGIDHAVFNLGDDFDTHVVEPYVAAHAAGVTPNPCIECNRHIKFDRLLERADQLGFDAVATGHHAHIVATEDGRWELHRGADQAKDQSYVVHMLDQDALARTLFPLGTIDKTEVRRIAADLGLRTADKPDSQDVCFISSDLGREAFLKERIPLQPAVVVDRDGQRLGEVDSVEVVTIGQRRGLGLPGGGPKRYVIDIDHAAHVVTVGEDSDLFDDHLTVAAVTWIDRPCPGRVLVQCSAHGRAEPAVVSVDGDRVIARWECPQRRIAPGQSAVFYSTDNQRVLGGGTVVS